MSDFFKDNKNISFYKNETMKVENLRKEKINEILNDFNFSEKLYSIGLSDNDIENNIESLIDFYDEYKICEKCKDIKDCLFKNKYVRKLQLINGKINFEFELCHKSKNLFLAKELSFICDIDDELLSKNIKDIHISKNRQQFILKLTEMVKKFDNNFIFLTSKKKSGGTFLTSVFYKEIISNKRISGAYADADKLYNRLTSIMFTDKNEFQDMMDKLCNVDFLVINKISNINFNEFTRNNILFPILEKRISKKLSTIFTSEVEYDDFLSLISFNKFKDIRHKQIKELMDDNFSKFNISINIKFYE